MCIMRRIRVEYVDIRLCTALATGLPAMTTVIHTWLADGRRSGFLATFCTYKGLRTTCTSRPEHRFRDTLKGPGVRVLGIISRNSPWTSGPMRSTRLATGHVNSMTKALLDEDAKRVTGCYNSLPESDCYLIFIFIVTLYFYKSKIPPGTPETTRLILDDHLVLGVMGARPPTRRTPAVVVERAPSPVLAVPTPAGDVNAETCHRAPQEPCVPDRG